MGKGFYWKLALTNLKNNRRVYLPYLLSSIGIITMFYIMCALGPGIDQENMYGGNSVYSMMLLGSYVIGFFAVVFLFYTNSFIMKRRKKELGLYNILGMEKRHISKIIFRETLMTAFSAILLGLGFGILFSKLMFLALGKILGLTVPIAFVIPSSAVLVTIALFAAIFLVTMLYNILQVRLAKPIELLHGGETGEKEPKAHWLLALLGAVSLGAGYYIAITIQNPVEALFFFFVAVILVIFGTYLLFITGITALLKILKKKKSFYYKTKHFTTISGMLYRMKQNAAGLASICILFTALLVTVSTTFSLYTSMDDLIRARFPHNVAIKSVDPSERVIEVFDAAVAKEVETSGIAISNDTTRRYRDQVVVRDGNSFRSSEDAISSTFGYLEYFTLEEFNRISGQDEQLSNGEVLMFDPRNSFPSDSLMIIDGKEIPIRKIDYDLLGGIEYAMLYDSYCLVFPDAASITAVSPQISGENYYRGFDVDGTEEDISNMGAALQETSNHIYDGNNEVQFDMLSIENSAGSRADFLSLYGGLFFLGLFLGVLFLMGTALIIYYKQVSEGYEDAKRFSIMKKVGMSHHEVKKSIHSQVLLVFFLPLLTAVLHLTFAFPMLQKIMSMMNLFNVQLILLSTLGCVIVFAIAYAIIYAITARTYSKIVETAAD